MGLPNLLPAKSTTRHKLMHPWWSSHWHVRLRMVDWRHWHLWSHYLNQTWLLSLLFLPNPMPLITGWLSTRFSTSVITHLGHFTPFNLAVRGSRYTGCSSLPLVGMVTTFTSGTFCGSVVSTTHVPGGLLLLSNLVRTENQICQVALVLRIVGNMVQILDAQSIEWEEIFRGTPSCCKLKLYMTKEITVTQKRKIKIWYKMSKTGEGSLLGRQDADDLHSIAHSCADGTVVVKYGWERSTYPWSWFCSVSTVILLTLTEVQTSPLLASGSKLLACGICTC